MQCDNSNAPLCCFPTPPDPKMPYCTEPGGCAPGESSFACDDQGDCPPAEVCCARPDPNSGQWRATCIEAESCSTSTNFNPDLLLLCEDPSECPEAFTCVPPVQEEIPNYMGQCVPLEYGPCVKSGGTDYDSCANPKNSCLTFSSVTMMDYHTCTGGCVEVSNCPDAPPNVSAQPACLAGLANDNRCFLDCAGGGTCPQGMTCQMVGTLDPNNPTVNICLWPA